jgi:hypothetical protein
MPVTNWVFTVDGVVQTSKVRYKTSRIDKQGAIESARVEFLDRDLTIDAMRPPVGGTLHITRDSNLEFGGQIARVTDRRLDGGIGGGTVTVVEARGWYYEADDVRIPLLILPAQTLQEDVEYLRETYLDAKGWTQLEAVPGGPALPVLIYENKTVAEIFDDLTKRSGYPWRVNGDKEMAFTEPSSLPAPNAYTDVNSVVLRGAEWSQDYVRKSSRLIVTTGGTAQNVPWQEDYAGDGARTDYPVHVLSPEVRGAINNAAGYIAGASTLAVDGLPPSTLFRDGATLRFGSHGLYTLSADSTTDADGLATISISPGLAEAVVDNQELTFSADTLVQVEVGGSPVPLDGSPWSYNTEQHILHTTTPTALTVSYKPRINYPARVRVWNADTILSTGGFDYAEVRDAELNWPQFTDVALAMDAAAGEIYSRDASPKTLKIATFTQDTYPWLLANCSFPDRLVEGTYLVQSTVITDVGRKDLLPRVELTLLESSRVGRNWLAFWKGDQTAGVQLLPPPPGVPPEIVQSNSGHFPSTAPSNALSFTTTPDVGNLVVVAFRRWQATEGGTGLSVYDNQGNTYTRQVSIPAGFYGLEMWTAPITTSSGTFTVTVDPADFEEHTIAIVEVSGVDLVTPNHQSAYGTKNYGDTFGVLDLANLTTACIVIGAATRTGSIGFMDADTGAGWSSVEQVDDVDGTWLSVIAKSASGAGSYDPTWTATFGFGSLVGIALKGT